MKWQSDKMMQMSFVDLSIFVFGFLYMQSRCENLFALFKKNVSLRLASIDRIVIL